MSPQHRNSEHAPPVPREPFGTMPDGRIIEQFTLANRRGMRVSVLSLGGIIRSIWTPDREGTVADVVLGFDSVEQYVADGLYIGALIGRYANRIAHGRFTLDGVEHELAVNQGANHMHGGSLGFHRALWSVEAVEHHEGHGLRLRYESPHGEGGYPGRLDVVVTYVLTEFNELVVSYRAETNQATPVNVTSHSYFNLLGAGRGDVLAHELTLGASHFTPVDRSMIPTGEIRSVRDTPFDFLLPMPTGARLGSDDEQLEIGYGYDHNFVIDDRRVDGLAFAARLRDPESGRWLAIYTTEPGIQLYLGSGLTGAGKGGRPYAAYSGLALEPQHYPNSPNEPSFPSTILRPGHAFTSRTVYRFGA